MIGSEMRRQTGAGPSRHRPTTRISKRTSRRLLALIGFCAALGLAGCGHSDLKAPCEAAEGALSYAELPHDCGPMRPVNGPLGAIDRVTTAGTEPLR